MRGLKWHRQGKPDPIRSHLLHPAVVLAIALEVFPDIAANLCMHSQMNAVSYPQVCDDVGIALLRMLTKSSERSGVAASNSWASTSPP